MWLSTADAQLFYEVAGEGAPLVLLHPYPTNHGFWSRLVPELAQRYQVITPDLRCHGVSECGAGPATMAKHADDLYQLLRALGVGRALFFGVSIGGYLLFEFWRRHREQARALILCDTRAQADTAEGRATRLKIAEEVLTQGPDEYLDGMTTKLLGATTRRNRPDLVAEARAMMAEMQPQGIASALRGMAERPDSVPTLKTITAPVLVMAGAEDELTPPADAELMHKNIRGSELAIIPAAGHYAPFENPAAVLPRIRQFLDALPAG